MTDLTLDERVTRLEELFKLHWGSLDIDVQKENINELHREMDKVKKALDATSQKWDEYQQSEVHQDFLKLRQERSKDPNEKRPEQ